MPRIKCPVCKAAGRDSKVHCEGWNSNGPRRVYDSHGHYFIWAKRYRCLSPEHDHHYTFQTYDTQVLEQLPDFIKLQFPCNLTAKAGIDKECVELVSSLFQSGMGAQTIETLLEELNAHRYYHNTHIFGAYWKAWNDRCVALGRAATQVSSTSQPSFCAWKEFTPSYQPSPSFLPFFLHTSPSFIASLQGQSSGLIQASLDRPRTGKIDVLPFKGAPCSKDKNHGATAKAYYLTKLYLRRHFSISGWIAMHGQKIMGLALCSDLSFKNVKKVTIDGETPFGCTLTVMNEYNQVHIYQLPHYGSPSMHRF